MRTIEGRKLMLGVDPSGNPIVLRLNADGTHGGTATVANFPADQKVHDDYASGECLAEQTGANNVLTFVFSSPCHLILVEAVGSGAQVVRCDPFGNIPTATLGIRCDDAVPTYIPVIATTIKVFAPASMVVSVNGFRRG